MLQSGFLGRRLATVLFGLLFADLAPSQGAQARQRGCFRDSTDTEVLQWREWRAVGAARRVLRRGTPQGLAWMRCGYLAVDFVCTVPFARSRAEQGEESCSGTLKRFDCGYRCYARLLAPVLTPYFPERE